MKNEGTGFSAIAITAPVGFLAADVADRWLATINPASTEKVPADKFTSSGSGTLGNTMNLATPSAARIAAGVVLTALPAAASMMVEDDVGSEALAGLAIGAAISTGKMLFTTLLVPRLLKPKDTSAAALQKSTIARLYPAEVSARINVEKKLMALSSSGSGALSGSPRFPDASQAARGLAELPTAHDALRAWIGTSDNMPTAQDVLRQRAGVSGDTPAAPSEQWQPGPPTDTGPGPQSSTKATCGCADPYASFLGDKLEDPFIVRRDHSHEPAPLPWNR